MAAPDIGACVGAGFNGLKKEPVAHIVSTLLVWIVSAFSGGLLTGPMLVGYMRLVKTADEGGKPQIGDLFKGFDDFVPALLAVLLSSIIVTIGFMLCIIPGVLIMALVPIAAYLVAVGEKDGIQAIRRAWELVKQNLLSTCLCMVILTILGSAGAILCGVGIILTLPIAFVGMYHMARQVAGGEMPALPDRG